jgi:hypothetical protein
MPLAAEKIIRSPKNRSRFMGRSLLDGAGKDNGGSILIIGEARQLTSRG